MIVLRFVFKRHVQLKDNNHKFGKNAQFHTYIQFFKALLAILNMIFLNINILHLFTSKFNLKQIFKFLINKKKQR